MKTPALIHKYLKAIAPLSLLLAVSPAQAAVYTYAGSGNWSTASNWDTGVVPNGVGVVISRTSSGNYTLTNDIGAVTVGTISYTSKDKFTINTGATGYSLTLDGGGSGAVIENASTAGGASLVLTNSGGYVLIADDVQIKQSDANSTLSATSGSYAISINARLVGTKSITITNVLNDLNYGLVNFGGGTTSSGTYTGAITLAKGALTWSSISAFGSASSVTLGSTGGGDVSLVSVYTAASFSRDITVAANTGGTTVLGSTVTSGTQKFSGNILLNQNLTVISQMTTADTSGVTLEGTISGTGGLQINGTVKSSGVSIDTTGIVKISGTNTFTGDTRVYKGTLLLGASSGTNSLALQYSTLDLDASDSGTVGFGLNSSTTITAATLGGLSGSRDLALQNIATTSAAVALSVGNNNSDTTYTGSLSGAGSLTKIGTGKLTLGGANTYTGATTISNGTLAVNGSLAAASAVTIKSGATLSGSGTVGGTVTGTSATISGSGLTMGATKLYGASTLSGYNIASSVTVSGGTTTLTGTTKSTSALSVAAGATLNANGTIDGSASISGLLKGNSTVTGNLALTSGTLSPGNSPGITTVSGDFTMDGSSTLIAEVSGSVAGTSYDQVKVSGNVSLAGTLNLTTLSGLTLGSTITLIDNTSSGTTSGYFATIITSGSTYTITSNADYTFTVNGTEYLLSYTSSTEGDGNGNDVTLTVVPEPGTWAMLVGGIGLLAFGQRMRRRN